MLVLISVKTGPYLGTWADVVIDLQVEIAFHDISLVVPIVFACPAAWGIGDLHQAAAVEEEPCLSAVGSMSPEAVELIEEEAFNHFRSLISVGAAVFNSELLCHRVGQFFDVIRQISKKNDNRPKYPAALAVRVELRFNAIARVNPPVQSAIWPWSCSSC